MLKLPPLPALRAFEAVARLGSVTQAAKELFVTHSAVSHQIKLLETYLNTALIDRSKRRIGLTDAGRSYAYNVRVALQQVANATNRMSIRQQSEHLTLAVLPSFGTHWLVPRLRDFYAQHPNWCIELIASLDLIDFEDSPVDCAIRFGASKTPKLDSIHLMTDWQVVVASAHDMDFSPQQTPAQAMAINRFIDTHEGWSTWSHAALVDQPLPVSALAVNDSNLALEAVRDGLGATLARMSIAHNWLKQGILKQVTPVIAPYESSHYQLVIPNRSQQLDKVLVFSDWLKKQCVQFEAEVQEMIQPTNAPKEFAFLKKTGLNLPLEKSP